MTASAQFSVEIAPEYFIWQEDTPFGTLEERGPRVVLGASYKMARQEGFLLGGSAKAYYGSVDYEGFLQDGSPKTSVTEYVGGLVEGQIIFRRKHQNYFGDAVLALGGDLWTRSLQGSGGYDEDWRVAYAKLAYEIGPQLQSGWIGTLGIKYPFYTAETVHLSALGPGISDVELEPGKNVSVCLEGGYRFKQHFSLAVYFDGYWFGMSDVKPLGSTGLGFAQPESKQFQIGLKGRWTF